MIVIKYVFYFSLYINLLAAIAIALSRWIRLHAIAAGISPRCCLLLPM